VFSRWRPRAALPGGADSTTESRSEVDLHEVAVARDFTTERESDVTDASIDRVGWCAFGGGAVAALAALRLPLAQAALSGLTTLVHEMGHAAFGWLFGYPSIPAFDFSYGGGVTLQQDRIPVLAFAVAGAAGYGAYALRARAGLRNALLALLGLYVPLALTRGHEAVILAMGHGGELAFATLALHRALSGRGCTVAAERPLYGLVGWFLVLSGLAFAWRLRSSALDRALYEDAKGGGHWMDFSRLAEQYLHVSLEAVATGFLVLCLLPPALALWLQRARRA
jgi:hypothetical protein